MLRHQLRHTIVRWLWRPIVGWLLLALLYLATAVLNLFLALAMVTWWPILLVVASLVIAGRCVLAALDHRVS